MWKVESISATNFMSFEEVSFDFKDKCYIVRAQNKDNDGQQSNGGGKTSFVDILSIVLLGYSLTGRNVKDCVNWNSDLGCFTAWVSLENKEYNLNCYIERKFYSKSKSAELRILVNKKPIATLPTKTGIEFGVDTREGNKYILENILDITEEDLLNYFLISKNHYSPFLEVNTDKKLEVIGRFTNTAVVDKAIQRVEVELEQDSDGVNEYNSQINQLQGYIKALQDSLNEDLERAFNEKKDADSALIQERITSVEEELVKLDESVKTLEEREESCREEWTHSFVDEKALSELKIRYDNLSYSESLEIVKEIEKDIAHINNHLAGVISCPACAHKFNLKSNEEFTSEDLDELEFGLKEVQSEIEACKSQRSELSNQIKELEDTKRGIKSIESEIETIKRNIKSVEQQQERLLKEYDRLESELKTITEKTFEDERGNVGEQIKQKEREISALTVQCEELSKELNNKSIWIKNFEDFKFYLGNKPTELICSLVNQYLKLNGSDLNLHIEGFKKIKSGEIRQALNPVIYRNWLNPQSLQQFSEGERVRLNVSVDLAFQQLINSSSKYGGLDLYVNDEMISGLDSLGVKNAAEAFNQLNKTIILVTHSGADLIYENTIVIEKENSISRII